MWFHCTTCSSAQRKTFPQRDSALGRILHITHIFRNLEFAFQALCQLVSGLPTCLPTLSSTIKWENDAFYLHSEASSECDHFNSVSTLQIDFFRSPPAPIPAADIFCRKNGSNTIPRKDNFLLVSWISRGWTFFFCALVFTLRLGLGRLPGKRGSSAAPNFSSCALTY